MNTYHTATVITYAEYKAMCRAINGKKTALIIGGLSLFLIVAGAGTWITNNRGLGIFFMVLGVIYPLLFHLVSNRAIRKVYRTTKISQNLPLDYTFESERVIVKSTNGESQIRYEDRRQAGLYRGEGELRAGADRFFKSAPGADRPQKSIGRPFKSALNAFGRDLYRC